MHIFLLNGLLNCMFMSRNIKYMSNKSRNVIFSKYKNPTSKILQDLDAEKNVDTSRFWVIFENAQNCMQIIGTSRRSIFHAPKSSQMPYTAKIN